MLEQHLKNRLPERQGAAVSNFTLRLPAPDSALAHEILKAPYLFDFLGLADDSHEWEIENALIRHITRFLLELGAGFAFVGRQFRLEVGDDEFFIDLLFYHTRLKLHRTVENTASSSPARSNFWRNWSSGTSPNAREKEVRMNDLISTGSQIGQLPATPFGQSAADRMPFLVPGKPHKAISPRICFS